MTDFSPVSAARVRVQIDLHGAARASSGTAVVALERKQAGLIAWLATNGATPRARLAGLLWPAAGEERARGNLRQSLSKLRQAAGDLFVEERGVLCLAVDVAVTAAAPGTSWLDAFEYADCSEFSAWLEGEREARRSALRRSLLTEVRAAAQAGALDMALRHADALLALDRESEEAYRTLMEVFYLRGDRAAAIAVWDRCREMLRGLYGVLPSAATQQLGQIILSAEAAAPAATSNAIPITVLRPPRLVGRVGVVDSLVEAWRLGDAVCVSGEGGIGKSRVLGEFMAAVGPCAAAAARPGDARLPFASLSRLVLAAIQRFQPPLEGESIDLAVRLLPQIAQTCGRPEPQPLRTAHERDEARRGLVELLTSCVELGCTAFVFDDLQFADRASVEALQELVEREAECGFGDRTGGHAQPLPARLALGSRGDELAPHAQSLLRSLASARRLTQVELDPFGEAEVLELMHSLELPGFDAKLQAPRLHRRVGGNPAYLLESVKLVAALGQLGDADPAFPVPPGIEAVVERRLALLSPEARHIAELAAVAGESFSVAMAGRALARPLAELSDTLRELEGRQVLYGRHFVHDIVASAVHRSVPAAVAEILHRFVAEELERIDAEPAVRASHWLACGEWRRAGDAFFAAAAKTRLSARPVERAQMLDSAADAYGRSGEQAMRFAALRERLSVSSAPDYMPTRNLQLDRLVAEAVGEEQQLQAMVETVSWHAEHLRSDTLALAEAGLARAGVLGLDRLAFEFAQPLAWQLAGRGESERALAVLEARRSGVLAQPDLSMHARFFIARSGVLAFSDRLAEAIDDSERGLAALREADDSLQMLPLLANLGLFRSWRGEFDAGRSVLLEATALRDRLHGRGTTLIIDLHLGAVLRDLGRFDEAEALLSKAVAEYRAQLAGDDELLTDLVTGENHLAQLWLLRGSSAHAEAAMVTDASSTELRFQARRATLRLRAQRTAGQHNSAVLAARTEALRELCAALPPASARFLGELELARVVPPAQALPSLLHMVDTDAMRERPGLQMHALGSICRAALQSGDNLRASAAAERLIAFRPSIQPFDIDPRVVWGAAHQALVAAGSVAGAKFAFARAEEARRVFASGASATGQFYTDDRRRSAHLPSRG